MARLGKSASIKIASILILGTVVGAGFQNCSKSLPDEAKSAASSTSPVVNAPAALAINASKTELSGSETVQMIGSGGTPPYTFTVVTGSGTLDSSNIFTAPSVSETNVVEIRDAVNNTAHITLNVTAALSLSYSSNYATEKIKLTASGGHSPYTFQLLAGIGTLNGDEFTPGSTVPATTLLQATDSTGAKVQVSLSVTYPARVTLYRMVDLSGSGLTYTLNTDPNAYSAWGYTSLGPAFHLFQSSGANTVQVVKCQYAGIAYYTSFAVGAASCPWAHTSLGVVGYMSTVARPNTVPVYSSPYYPGALSLSSSDFGYSALGGSAVIAGYVMAP